MNVKSTVALFTFVVIGFSAHAYNHDEAVSETPAVVSLDCITQVDAQTAVINPKCLSKQAMAIIQPAPVSSCLAQCARMTNVAESSACYSRCYGGR